MRRHYIVVQLPTSAPVAELVPEMIAVAWGVSAIMTNIKVTNMRNYSREIFQEVGLQRPGSQGVQSTRRWPPPLTTSASFYLSPTLCPTNPPPPPGRIYDKIYLTKCKLYFFELQTVFGVIANCICPNFKIYLSKFPFSLCQQLFATPSHLRQEEKWRSIERLDAPSICKCPCKCPVNVL